MVATVRQFVTVEAGGIVRVQSSDLREGEVAEVLVLTRQPPLVPDSDAATATTGSTWRSFIGSGVSTGRTVAEIDAYLRELRDEWDR